MSLIIGLTGGIATGKTTISNLFIKHNIPVIDSDILARKVVEKNQPAYNKIIQEFGSDILLSSGDLNRKLLGEIIFNDDHKRKILNNIVHPEVRKATIEAIDIYQKLGYKVIVLDVPLLFESHFDELCDYTVVVYANESVQLDRLIKRDNLTMEEAMKRINTQMSLTEKVKLAHFTIDNSNSLIETKAQFTKLMQKW